MHRYVFHLDILYMKKNGKTNFACHNAAKKKKRILIFNGVKVR